VVVRPQHLALRLVLAHDDGGQIAKTALPAHEELKR
jgi:hypothetical protein